MKHTEHDAFYNEALDTLNRIYSENSRLRGLAWFLNNAAARFNKDILGKKQPKVIVFGDDIPAEILYAVCDDPFYILGGSLEAAHWADELTPRDTDPFSRSSLGWLVNPSFDLTENALIVTAVSSDSRRKLISILKSEGRNVEAIDVPPDHRSPNAVTYFTRQLETLAEKIGKVTGKHLTFRSLKKAVRLTAAARRERQRFIAAAGGVLSDEAVLLVAQSMYFSEDLAELTARLSDLIDETEAMRRRFAYPKKDKPSVLILGSPVIFPNYKVPQLISSAGMHITALADSPSVEASLAAPRLQSLRSADALLKKTAETHLRMIASGARINNTGLYSYFLNLMDRLEPDGVVYHVLKGQIEYDFELPAIEKAAESKNIPVFRLETDYQYQDMEQLRIRMEAFGEMLTQRRIAERRRRRYA